MFNKVWNACKDVLLVSLLIFLLAPQFAGGDEVMPLGDLLQKVARNEQLTPGELETLRLKLNEMEAHDAITSGWIGQDGQPNVRNIDSTTGRFVVPPIGASAYVFSVDNLLDGISIPNATTTILSFSTYQYWDTTSVIIPYGTGNDKFQINPIYSLSNAKAIQIFIYASSYPNISGFHNLALKWYKKSDDSYVSPLQESGHAATENAVDFGMTFIVSIQDVVRWSTLYASDLYFKIGFYHEGGSGKRLVLCHLGASVLR